MKTITTVSQVKTILKITTVAPSQCLHKYRREITFLMACNNVKHCCLSARWSLASFKHETSIWSRMLLKIIQFWNLFQVCANIDKIKAYMWRCLLVCLIVWVFSMYLYWNSGELKSKTFLMRHIVNSCHVAWYRKIACIMIYVCSLCFIGGLQKKLGETVFLSSKQHL